MEFSDIRSVSNVVKFFEAFVVVILLSWSTTRLPFAVKLSVDYLTEFSLFLSSTPSVFLIGNVIIIALVAKFPTLEPNAAAASENDGDDEDLDLYDEFVGEVRRKVCGTHETLMANAAGGEENKHIVCAVRQVTTESGTAPGGLVEPTGEKGFSPVWPVQEERAAYRRSKSETFAGKNNVDILKSEGRKELRRTATGYGGRFDGGVAERVVEELSNDEFKRTVEEFIAKQKSFLREENLAIVSSNRNAV